MRTITVARLRQTINRVPYEEFRLAHPPHFGIS